MSDLERLSQGWWPRLLAGAFLVVLIVAWSSGGASDGPFGLWDERDPSGEGKLSCQDFASHLRMVRSRFTEVPGPGSLYSVEAHLEMMRAWTGKRETMALPFAYSPTMVALLAPFAALSDRAAYLLWTALGLLAVLWMIGPRRDPWLVGCLIVAAPLTARAFALGQTAPLSTAALVWLLLARAAFPSARMNAGVSLPGPSQAPPIPGEAKGHDQLREGASVDEQRPHRPPEDGSRFHFLGEAVVLWALTAKPPVALAAGAALLALGRWRAVLAAVLLTGVTTALLWPWLGEGWVDDYLQMARAYNVEQADPTFAWCLSPTYLGNLRAVLFSLGVPDARTSSLTWMLWLASLAAVLVAGWRGWLPAMASSALLVLGYLLLAPHVNITEDLQLYVVALALGHLAVGRPQWRRAPFVVLVVVLIASQVGSDNWLWNGLTVAGKFALAVLLVFAGLRSPLQRSEP